MIHSEFKAAMKVRNYILLFILVSTAIYAQDNENRYGVCLIDGQSIIGCNTERFFAMHSVMKFPQALYVVEYLKLNGLSINDSILIDTSELEYDTWSPMLNDFDGETYVTYAQLLKYSLAQSDNNACDLLFEHCGSPLAVEQYIRSIGFNNIHIRLTEKEMHATPDRVFENCCTPLDMANLLEWFYLHISDNEYYEYLSYIMENCKTGLERVSSVIPDGSKFVHKTGTGFTNSNGETDRNDVGIVCLPDDTHITIVVFVPNAKTESDVAVIAKRYILKAAECFK